MTTNKGDRLNIDVKTNRAFNFTAYDFFDKLSLFFLALFSFLLLGENFVYFSNTLISFYDCGGNRLKEGELSSHNITDLSTPIHLNLRMF